MIVDARHYSRLAGAIVLNEDFSQWIAETFVISSNAVDALENENIHYAKAETKELERHDVTRCDVLICLWFSLISL